MRGPGNWPLLSSTGDCRIMKGALIFGRRQEFQSQNAATLKGDVLAAAVPNECRRRPRQSLEEIAVSIQFVDHFEH